MYIHVFLKYYVACITFVMSLQYLVCYSNIIHILVVVFQSFQCVLYSGMLLQNAKGIQKTLSRVGGPDYVYSSRNCLSKFRKIQWNQTMDVH